MSDTKNLQGIWTQYGQERMAAWVAGGEPLVITAAAVGNGGGSIPSVSPTQTELVGEEWRGLVNGVQLNPQDATDVIVELVLPNDIGGFWIREWGVFDNAGELVAVGPHDEMHKPLIASGQAAEILELFHLPVSNSGAIKLTIATQALASQDFVRTEINAHDADPGAHGFVMGQEGQILAVQDGKLTWIDRFFLCEVYPWRHPTLKPGFQPAQGGLLENAAVLYPKAWAYLQTTEGQKLCKTEAEWQALTTEPWATLADGTKVSWNGIGGAPWYAPNWNTGALRLPDLRGMYEEMAGYDGLDAGGVHGDGTRNMWGAFWSSDLTSGLLAPDTQFSGAFYNKSGLVAVSGRGTSAEHAQMDVQFDGSRTAPIANKVQPRAWGALACVYLGLPAS